MNDDLDREVVAACQMDADASREVQFDLNVSAFMAAVDALVKQVESRAGVQHLRANWQFFSDHLKKATDIHQDMMQANGALAAFARRKENEH